MNARVEIVHKHVVHQWVTVKCHETRLGQIHNVNQLFQHVTLIRWSRRLIGERVGIKFWRVDILSGSRRCCGARVSSYESSRWVHVPDFPASIIVNIKLFKF